MPDLLYPLMRPILQRMEAEDAHRLTIRALNMGAARLWGQKADTHKNLAQRLFGLAFPNPVGLAPGFDKNAEALGGLCHIGFGFVEVGTVTPRPQDGNPRPRLFRLLEDDAVINRMGFNNDGMEAVRSRLKNRPGGVIGINIGANKDSNDRVADYVTAFDQLHPFADYITINVSSPNTPGLRGLQDRGPLRDLIVALNARRDAAARPVPMLLKLAPDLDDQALEDIAEIVTEETLDGVILTNTTVERPESLTSSYANEVGGLSGRPLFTRSTDILRKFYWLTGGQIPIIGVGGIASAEDAYEKILSGASLVQLYSALALQGPGLVGRLLDGLSELVARDRFASISEAVGAGAKR